MYNNALQLNWKVGHGMPLTSVANNVESSAIRTGQNIGIGGAMPTLTNNIPSMSRAENVNSRKISKKISGKRAISNNISKDKNVRNNANTGNNISRGDGCSATGDSNITERNTSGRKNKNKSYTLRACSIQKRLETEHRTKLPRKRGPKPRPKTAPMSKYRRKTANLRERQRMGEINVAFEILREKLPSPISLKNGGKCEKLTKINILHIAINYIRAMENLLETGDSGVNSFKEMVKNPIRDDQDRKMEVQKVLEALMKRADNISSGNSSVSSLKRLASSRNGISSRSKGSDRGGGKQRNVNKGRKEVSNTNENIPEGVFRNRTDNIENFDSAKAMSFLLSTLGSNFTDPDTDHDRDDEKSEDGTSDDEDDDTGQSGLQFENMIMLPEWSELSSTLDISSLSNNRKMDTSTTSVSMPNLFVGGEGNERSLPKVQIACKEDSNNFQKFNSFATTNSMAFESCSSANMITTSSSVNVVNETILAKPEIRQPSNPLLLELMPVPQNNIKKQNDLLSSSSHQVSSTLQNISPVSMPQGINQTTSSINLPPSCIVSMSPNSSNCSLSSNSSNTSLCSSSSTMNSPISPSISLFKEPDPLFASVGVDKTHKFDIKQPEQGLQGLILHQNNSNVKLEARKHLEPALSYVGIINSFQNEEIQSNLQQQQTTLSSIKENNNHLLNGSIGVNTTTGDDIMMRDFTDFVEMVDSLNGMPDIEFVEDNFEIFPT